MILLELATPAKYEHDIFFKNSENGGAMDFGLITPWSIFH